ncbi:MAG: hypothetical protein HGA80_08670, partial [Candidatus Omnitrophica bacterium]|nr:hypothetical protein [Candidatus Omnitrophota bacterium]
SLVLLIDRAINPKNPVEDTDFEKNTLEKQNTGILYSQDMLKNFDAVINPTSEKLAISESNLGAGVVGSLEASNQQQQINNWRRFVDETVEKLDNLHPQANVTANFSLTPGATTLGLPLGMNVDVGLPGHNRQVTDFLGGIVSSSMGNAVKGTWNVLGLTNEGFKALNAWNMARNNMHNDGSSNKGLLPGFSPIQFTVSESGARKINGETLEPNGERKIVQVQISMFNMVENVFSSLLSVVTGGALGDKRSIFAPRDYYIPGKLEKAFGIESAFDPNANNLYRVVRNGPYANLYKANLEEMAQNGGRIHFVLAAKREFTPELQKNLEAQGLNVEYDGDVVDMPNLPRILRNSPQIAAVLAQGGSVAVHPYTGNVVATFAKGEHPASVLRQYIWKNGPNGRFLVAVDVLNQPVTVLVNGKEQEMLRPDVEGDILVDGKLKHIVQKHAPALPIMIYDAEAGKDQMAKWVRNYTVNRAVNNRAYVTIQNPAAVKSTYVRDASRPGVFVQTGVESVMAESAIPVASTLKDNMTLVFSDKSGNTAAVARLSKGNQFNVRWVDANTVEFYQVMPKDAPLVSMVDLRSGESRTFRDSNEADYLRYFTVAMKNGWAVNSRVEHGSDLVLSDKIQGADLVFTGRNGELGVMEYGARIGQTTVRLINSEGLAVAVGTSGSIAIDPTLTQTSRVDSLSLPEAKAPVPASSSFVELLRRMGITDQAVLAQAAQVDSQWAALRNSAADPENPDGDAATARREERIKAYDAAFKMLEQGPQYQEVVARRNQTQAFTNEKQKLGSQLELKRYETDWEMNHQPPFKVQDIVSLVGQLQNGQQAVANLYSYLNGGHTVAATTALGIKSSAEAISWLQTQKANNNTNIAALQQMQTTGNYSNVFPSDQEYAAAVKYYTGDASNKTAGQIALDQQAVAEAQKAVTLAQGNPNDTAISQQRLALAQLQLNTDSQLWQRIQVGYDARTGGNEARMGNVPAYVQWAITTLQNDNQRIDQQIAFINSLDGQTVTDWSGVPVLDSQASRRYNLPTGPVAGQTQGHIVTLMSWIDGINKDLQNGKYSAAGAEVYSQLRQNMQAEIDVYNTYGLKAEAAAEALKAGTGNPTEAAQTNAAYQQKMNEINQQRINLLESVDKLYKDYNLYNAKAEAERKDYETKLLAQIAKLRAEVQRFVYAERDLNDSNGAVLQNKEDKSDAYYRLNLERQKLDAFRKSEEAFVARQKQMISQYHMSLDDLRVAGAKALSANSKLSVADREAALKSLNSMIGRLHNATPRSAEATQISIDHQYRLTARKPQAVTILNASKQGGVTTAVGGADILSSSDTDNTGVMFISNNAETQGGLNSRYLIYVADHFNMKDDKHTSLSSLALGIGQDSQWITDPLAKSGTFKEYMQNSVAIFVNPSYVYTIYHDGQRKTVYGVSAYMLQDLNGKTSIVGFNANVRHDITANDRVFIDLGAGKATGKETATLYVMDQYGCLTGKPLNLKQTNPYWGAVVKYEHNFNKHLSGRVAVTAANYGYGSFIDLGTGAT